MNLSGVSDILGPAIKGEVLAIVLSSPLDKLSDDQYVPLAFLNAIDMGRGIDIAIDLRPIIAEFLKIGNFLLEMSCKVLENEVSFLIGVTSETFTIKFVGRGFFLMLEWDVCKPSRGVWPIFTLSM
jgi:hypothetical protein